jgi:MFS family permease
MEPAQKAGRRMPGTVWALGAVSFFTDVGGEMIFPLLPALMAGMPGGAAAVGTVEGIADAVSHLVKPWVGAHSDRFRRRKPFVLAGYALTGLSRPFLGLAGSVAAVTGIRSADRLGKGIRNAPRDALIAGSVEKGRLTRAFSLNQAMDHAGAVVGPLLAALFLSLKIPLARIFYFSAIPGALAVATVLFFVREGAPPAPKDGAPAPAGSPPLPPRLKSYLAILGFFYLSNSTDALLLVRCAALGMRPRTVTLAYVLLNAVKVTTSYGGGALADRFGSARMILPGWLVYAAVYLGFAFAPSAVWIWPLFAVYGCYYGLTEGAEKTIVSRLAPPEAKGRAFGLMGFSMGAGVLVSSIGTEWLYRELGPGWAFGTGAGIAVVAAIALGLWSYRVSPGSS